VNGFRFLPSSAHGVIDYLMGLMLLAAPNLLGFADGSAAEWVPRAAGVLVLGLSLTTDYEAGLVTLVPFQAHLWMDAVLAAGLIASPWLFGFASGPSSDWMPHVVLGVAELLVVGITRPFAYADRPRAMA
jgi:hypothetical protein